MKFPLALLGLCCAAQAAPVPLFDGKTLDGWEIPDAEKKWWKVEDGKIVGGSLEEKVPKNTFLSLPKSYADFDFRFQVKMTKKEGFANSGIQVRSIRKPDDHMSGYQVDAGIGYWGTIWDEHRRIRRKARSSSTKPAWPASAPMAASSRSPRTAPATSGGSPWIATARPSSRKPTTSDTASCPSTNMATTLAAQTASGKATRRNFPGPS